MQTVKIKVPKRNPMAVGNEPTDQELEQVMRGVQDVVRARKLVTQQWITDQLAKAVREAQTRQKP